MLLGGRLAGPARPAGPRLGPPLHGFHTFARPSWPTGRGKCSCVATGSRTRSGRTPSMRAISGVPTSEGTAPSVWRTSTPARGQSGRPAPALARSTARTAAARARAGTTLHELGHALDGLGIGRGVEWKRTARERLGLRRAMAGRQRYVLAAIAPQIRAEVVRLIAALVDGRNPDSAAVARARADPCRSVKMMRLPSSVSFSLAKASSSKDQDSERSSRVSPVMAWRYSLPIHLGASASSTREASFARSILWRWAAQRR